MDLRLIALDLDGTTLNSQGKVSPYTKEILEKAILNGGTTIRSYESSEGVHGKFQQNLLVHNRENENYPNCKNKIIKIKVGGRGTYYCPSCQKL